MGMLPVFWEVSLDDLQVENVGHEDLPVPFYWWSQLLALVDEFNELLPLQSLFEPITIIMKPPRIHHIHSALLCTYQHPR